MFAAIIALPSAVAQDISGSSTVAKSAKATSTKKTGSKKPTKSSGNHHRSHTHAAAKPHVKTPNEITATRLAAMMSDIRALIEAGNLDDAERECNGVLASHPNDKNWLKVSADIKAARLLGEANSAFVGSDLDAAEAKANEALSVKPGDPATTDLLSKIKEARYKEAMTDAQDATDLEIAEKKIEAILVRFPDDKAAAELLEKTKTQLHTQRVEQAQSSVATDPDLAEKIAKSILEKDPKDEDAATVLDRVRLSRYMKAIAEAQAEATTDPDAAEQAVTRALELKPGDSTAKELLTKIKAGHKSTTKLTALNDAKADLAQGLTAKAVQEYKALVEAYPSDLDLRLTAAKVIFDSGALLQGADMAEAGLRGTSYDADRNRVEAVLNDWRTRFDPLNVRRFNAAVEMVKVGQVADAADTLVASSRLLADRRVGLVTEWLGAFAAGREDQAVDALKGWIKLGNRKVEDVAMSPLYAALPDLVHRAVTDERSARWITDAFGADGPHQIETAAAHAAANADGASIPSGAVKKNPIFGGDMVWVPAGPFVMGDSAQTDKSSHLLPIGPRHKVQLSGFWIGKTPVTVGQFKVFCSATGLDFSKFAVPEWGWIDEHPMVNVTWQQARDFCKWAGGDLPSEAQWEKAARGADGLKYPWGNQWDGARLRWNARQTAAVDANPTGASPYGCLDMAGNVWQWCLDWFGDLDAASSTQDPTGPKTGQDHVLHGGGWDVTLPPNLRSAARSSGHPWVVKDDIGFRLVCP
jgi:formylglycine-generating enzyme required for sulfatase activity